MGLVPHVGQRSSVSRRNVLATVFLIWATALPSDGVAQVLIGSVLEEGRSTPVAAAILSLMDEDGRLREQTISDSLGHFVLAPPEAGRYVVEAKRLGYSTTRSPLFAFEVTGSVSFEIMLSPVPIGIAGLEVSVEGEAEWLLGQFGLTPATLGRRWIGRDEIDDMPLPPGPREVIRWRSIAGLWLEPQLSSAPPRLCVTIRHRGCASVYLNGVPTSLEAAQAINSDDLKAIAILRPIEATTFYGTGGSNGVVLLWTR